MATTIFADYSQLSGAGDQYSGVPGVSTSIKKNGYCHKQHPTRALVCAAIVTSMYAGAVVANRRVK